MYALVKCIQQFDCTVYMMKSVRYSTCI